MKMKGKINKAIRREKGQALIATLILLLLGGLITAPLLSFMSTGLETGVVFEEDMNELYAADSGVEDALQQIITNADDLPSEGNSWSYEIADVNDKAVSIIITCIDDDAYEITSTATTDADSSTTIVAYVTSIWGDYAAILSHVITSQGDYTLQGPCTVYPPAGAPNGPVDNYTGAWPTPEELADFYFLDVEDVTPYPTDFLDVQDYASIGPLYRNGTLSIQNNGVDGLTLTLNGTVYITGDTEIGTTGHDFTLNLNGQTIFVESDTTGIPYALRIGGKCTITGSGCIIAIGDIEFKPNLSSNEGDFVFVMSVTGMTYMQPGGNFYGALAGSTEVWIKNGNAYWGGEDGAGNLNFPGSGEGGTGGKNAYEIRSWEINQP